MPPIVVASAGFGGTNATNPAITVPAAAQNGDVILVTFINYEQYVVTPPDPLNWTVTGTAYTGGGTYWCRYWQGWRIKGASTPSSFTFTSGSNLWSAFLVVIRDADELAPISAFAAYSTGSASTAWTAPSVTPTTSNGLLLCHFGSMGNSSSLNNAMPSAPLTYVGRGQCSTYVACACGSQDWLTGDPTGTRSGSGLLGSWWGLSTVIKSKSLPNSYGQAEFGAEGDLSGGSAVYYLGGTADVSLDANTFLTNTYLGATVDLSVQTEDVDWGPRILLEGAESQTEQPRATVGAYGNLSVQGAPVVPPSDVVYVKRVTPVMPPPTLDSRGRPI